MILKGLSVTNFKNIPQAKLQFSPKINCMLGDNGMGKSNLLDAIYYMSFCKSFSGVTDNMLITKGEDFCMVQADYHRRDTDETINAGMQRGGRKTFKRGNKEYQRLSEHIGLFPLVLISPADMQLVSDAPEVRRRFADMVISQTDPRYLDMLIRYNHAMQQRNNMLRQETTDPTLYMAVEAMMDGAARYITQCRRKFVADVKEILRSVYPAIAGNAETVDIRLRSQMTDPANPEGELLSLEAMLDHDRQRDMLLHHTASGPHRDDIEMTIDSMPLRRTASQGQAKTFTVALRLAQYEFLHRATGLRPLLLLDDVFDKLDSGRMERMMHMLAGDKFGQIFLTDTNAGHIDEIVRLAGGHHKIFNVKDGQITPIEQ